VKEEIKQIIEMSQQGKIDIDQAAELIAALNEKQQKESNEKTVEFDGISELISKTIAGALSGNLGKMRGKIGKANLKFNMGDEKGENEINNSSVSAPDGDSFDFNENEFHMSKVSGLKFESSAIFSENQVHASSLTGINLSSGGVQECAFHGSSVDDLNINDSVLAECQFHGSKVSHLMILENSEIKECEFHGSTLKQTSITKQSKISEVQLAGISTNMFNVISTTWSEIDFHGCSMINSTFKDLKWKEGQVSNCNFVNCEISNVELSEFELSDINVKDVKINGNTEFQSFLGRNK